MKSLFRYCLVLLISLLPAQVVAMADGGHASHDQETVKDQVVSEHDTMTAEGLMFIVGDMTSKGVRGMAHLKDVQEAMTKMGSSITHHFMIAFVDVETGEQIESGQVALKLQDPDGKVSEPIALQGMQGHFGADIVMDKEGEYHLKLGAQFTDGIKRKYHFHHKVK